MQPSQPPPVGPPYYVPPQPMAQPMAMPIPVNKRLIFVIVVLGALLMWIGQLARWSFGTSSLTDLGRAGLALFHTGALIGFGGSVLGALGSERTGDYRNLGLLILAGFFLTATAL